MDKDFIYDYDVVRKQIAKSYLKIEGFDFNDDEISEILNLHSCSSSKLTNRGKYLIANLIGTFNYLSENIDMEYLELNDYIYVKLNGLIGNNLGYSCGVIRNNYFFLHDKNLKIAPPDKDYIRELIAKLNNLTGDNYKDIVAEFFAEMIRIQPFYAENKKTTLILINLALLRDGLGYFSISNEYFEDFLFLTEQYRLGKSKELVNLIKDRLIFDLVPLNQHKKENRIINFIKKLVKAS